MKRGLVLEGGGLRCLYTCGILDVLLEHEVKFDGLIGVSAGITLGCNFMSRQPGRALRYNQRFSKDPDYVSLRSWIKTGDLVNKKRAYHDVPMIYDPFDYKTFCENPMECHLVCTDVMTGKPVYKQLTKQESTEEFMEWARATSSMPLVSNAVELEGHKLLDGGISDSIPLKHFQEIGYERNVVILSQPAGFYKKKTKLIPIFRLFHKYPEITKDMARRHLMYNAELDYIQQEEKKGNTLLIYPKNTIGIGRVEMNPAKMEKIYQEGREKGSEIVQQVIDFLKK